MEREGLKGREEVLASRSSGSLLQCDVSGGKRFSFIYQPTIG